MLEIFKQFWAESGWVANLLTIVLGIITILGILISLYKSIKSKMDNINDFSNISNFIKSCGHLFTYNKLKERKIAIIDDQPSNYPIDYLRKAGFNITVYESVSLSDYAFISNYDLIFLDITNVVEEDLERGGFELIKRVRAEMKDIVIIGVSSKRFDPTLTEFFKLADEQSKTPISENECENLILDILEKHYSPVLLASKIDNVINESSMSHKQHKKVVNHIIKYLEGKVSGETLLKSITKYSYSFNAHEVNNNILKLKDLL